MQLVCTSASWEGAVLAHSQVHAPTLMQTGVSLLALSLFFSAAKARNCYDYNLSASLTLHAPF